MTAIAASWPISIQVGVITLGTMSAANSNSRPSRSHTPKRSHISFLSPCVFGLPRHWLENSEERFNGAIRHNQNCDDLHAHRNLACNFFEQLFHQGGFQNICDEIMKVRDPRQSLTHTG